MKDKRQKQQRMSDRRVNDYGPGHRSLAGEPQDMEACAKVVANTFCGFYYGKHIGSFQHEFVRPPLLTGDSECSNCGAAACRGVKLVAACINGQVKVRCLAQECSGDSARIEMRTTK